MKIYITVKLILEGCTWFYVKCYPIHLWIIYANLKQCNKFNNLRKWNKMVNISTRIYSVEVYQAEALIGCYYIQLLNN